MLLFKYSKYLFGVAGLLMLLGQNGAAQNAPANSPFSGELKFKQGTSGFTYQLKIVRGRISGGSVTTDQSETVAADVIGGWYDQQKLCIMTQKRGDKIKEPYFTRIQHYIRKAENFELEHQLYGYGKTEIESDSVLCKVLSQREQDLDSIPMTQTETLAGATDEAEDAMISHTTIRQARGTLCYSFKHMPGGRIVSGAVFHKGSGKTRADITGGWIDAKRIVLAIQFRGTYGGYNYFSHIHQFQKKGDLFLLEHSLYGYGITADTEPRALNRPHILDNEARLERTDPVHDPKLMRELTLTYKLQGSQVVRRFEPPYPESRNEYLQKRFQDQFPRIHSTFWHMKNGELTLANARMTSNESKPGLSLTSLLQTIAQVNPVYLLGDDAEILITGDFVWSPDAGHKERLIQLTEILSDQLQRDVDFEFVTIPQETLVISGTLKDSRALSIEITNIPNLPGDTTDQFSWMTFTNWLGDRLNVPHLDKSQVSQKKSIRCSMSKGTAKKLTSKDRKELIESVSEQSGLDLHFEKLPTEMLKISISERNQQQNTESRDSEMPDADAINRNTPAQNIPIPTTGESNLKFDPLDKTIVDLMGLVDASAGCVAVSHDGELVYSRGFGWRDSQRRQTTEPHTLFRIAGVSKVITKAMVKEAIRTGKLKPDDKVFEILSRKTGEFQFMDPRLEKITVQQLLDHKGGWDRNNLFGPAIGDRDLNPWHVVHFLAEQPLDFEPGSKSVNSNYGYSLLGRVLEVTYNRPYIESVDAMILKSLETDEIQLAFSSSSDRRVEEVSYPVADRSVLIEARDASGGLIASAPALCRFLDHFWINGTRRKENQRYNYWAVGTFPGTTAYLKQTADGWNIAVLFNNRNSKYVREDISILSERIEHFLNSLD